MKYILILLISFNAMAQIKYTRFQGESRQGELIVADTAEFIERALKMIKVKRGWMKCDWKADVHALNIKTSQTFQEQVTPDDPETLEIDESVYADVIVDTYCHPKNFDFTSEDITQELADKAAAKQADKDERQQIKSMVSNINKSSKPNWEKKLLKKLIRDMRE